jgi:hypothetical protein
MRHEILDRAGSLNRGKFFLLGRLRRRACGSRRFRLWRRRRLPLRLWGLGLQHFRLGRCGDDCADRAAARPGQLRAVAFEALQRLAASRLHSDAMRYEIRSAGLPQRFDLLRARLRGRRNGHGKGQGQEGERRNIPGGDGPRQLETCRHTGNSSRIRLGSARLWSTQMQLFSSGTKAAFHIPNCAGF